MSFAQKNARERSNKMNNASTIAEARSTKNKTELEKQNKTENIVDIKIDHETASTTTIATEKVAVTSIKAKEKKAVTTTTTTTKNVTVTKTTTEKLLLPTKTIEQQQNKSSSHNIPATQTFLTKSDETKNNTQEEKTNVEKKKLGSKKNKPKGRNVTQKPGQGAAGVRSAIFTTIAMTFLVLLCVLY